MMNGSTTARIREVPTDSPLISRKWLLDNGAHEVELIDDSDAGWSHYCASLLHANRQPTGTTK